MARKHIATYPLYGTFPMTGKVNTRNRVGTGYIYSHEQIAEREAFLATRDHPLRLRWRNDECYAAYCEWLSRIPDIQIKGAA